MDGTDPARAGDGDAATVGVALWAANLAYPVNGLDGWLSLADGLMAEAKARGAALFVMPEYASAHWLAQAPAALKPTEIVGWMAEEGTRALPRLQALAIKHDLAVVAGSMPIRRAPDADRTGPRPAGSPEFLNRSWILLPDGKGGVEIRSHDKLVLTPAEKDPQGWLLAQGRHLRVVSWRGLRFLVLICLDIEMPGVAQMLVDRDIDLVLVPSMTGHLSGYHRVFDCAKARAVELFAIVGAVGCIGRVGAGGIDGNCSGAAFFAPCEVAFGATGLVDRTGPFTEVEGPGPLLVSMLPIGALRQARRAGAEVWQGGFDTGHLLVEDMARA